MSRCVREGRLSSAHHFGIPLPPSKSFVVTASSGFPLWGSLPSSPSVPFEELGFGSSGLTRAPRSAQGDMGRPSSRQINPRRGPCALLANAPALLGHFQKKVNFNCARSPGKEGPSLSSRSRPALEGASRWRHPAPADQGPPGARGHKGAGLCPLEPYRFHLVPSMQAVAAGVPPTAHTQPALRTGLMAPAWRLLHVSWGLALDLT